MSKIDALRVSVTDRCNLRCVYCMPEAGVPTIPHAEILSFEELERVVRVAVHSGVSKVRLTGGEPLVRKNIVTLVEKLARVPGLRDLPMTTNGVLLADLARDLKSAGLSRVTVSLDTLRPERFERIARRPWLYRVMAGLEAALAAGFDQVKVNVVMAPGVNDDELLDFVEFARERDLEVRFIERMPLLGKNRASRCGIVSEDYIPAARLLAGIEEAVGKLEPIGGIEPGSPARVYALPAGKGRIGFIAAMSEPFCKWCKRMRLTPDGKLRVCLAQDLELDLKGPLRNGAGDNELARLFNRAAAMKPKQEAACFAPISRFMSQIGG